MIFHLKGPMFGIAAAVRAIRAGAPGNPIIGAALRTVHFFHLPAFGPTVIVSILYSAYVNRMP